MSLREHAADRMVGDFRVYSWDGVQEVSVFAQQLLPQTAHVIAEQRGERQFAVVGLQLVGEHRIIAEREVLGLGFEEEVKRIEDRHLGDEIDLALSRDGDRIRAVRATARGCSLSVASTSMLTVLAPGRTAAEVAALRERLNLLLAGDAGAGGGEGGE